MLNIEDAVSVDDLVALVLELLDAHRDTVELVKRPVRSPEVIGWAAHLDYLQALQRVGRAALARVAVV